MRYVKMFFALGCLLSVSACGSSADTTQLASWDNMYYYDVDMPK